MATVNEEFLLYLLQACVAVAPEPLYPARFAGQENLERDKLDAGLDELRRRGLVRFTEWVRDAGQGYAPTDEGRRAAATMRLPSTPAAPAIGKPLAKDAINPYERGEMVRSALLAPRRPYACWALLIANVLFFVGGAMYAWLNDASVIDYLRDGRARKTVRHHGVMEQGVPILLELGGLWAPVTVPEGRPEPRPQLERLLLFLFLHAGILHLFMNMYFLATMGGEIEAMWGSARFLAIYFVAGLVSGCVIILIGRLEERNPLVVGASGPLCGLFTAMVVWFALNYEHLPDRLLQDWSRMLGTSLFLLIAINFFPNVSWQGHFGGALGGLLAALLLHVQRFHPSPGVRVMSLASLPLIPAAFFGVVLWQAGWF